MILAALQSNLSSASKSSWRLMSHAKRGPRIPNLHWSLFNKISWLTTAFLKSTNATPTRRPESTSCLQVSVLETISIRWHSFCSGAVSYVINNATFEEIGQTRGSSAAAIQFSFRNRAKFHSRFLCYQCIFDPVPLSPLSLFSGAFAFSSNLICWRPREMYGCAENQCHCCCIYHFQRPDLICEMPASDPASPPSTRFPCSREKSSSHKRRQENCTMSPKETSLLTWILRQKCTP